MALQTFYEDIVVGAAERFGRAEVTREEVLTFAAKYDPQPFHLSDEAAANSHFGRLAASGWQTCGWMMAMLAQHFTEIGYASMGAAGIDELRWLKPVYPGDVLSLELLVSEKRRSKSRPEMGLLRQHCTAFNQHDEAVCRFISAGMVKTRDHDGTD